MSKELSPAEKAWEEHNFGMDHHTFRDKSHFLVGHSAGDKHGQRAMVEKTRKTLAEYSYLSVGLLREILDKLEAEVKDA